MIDSRIRINHLLHPNTNHYKVSRTTETPEWLSIEYIEPKPLTVMKIEPCDLNDIKVIGYENVTVMDYYDKVRLDDEHDILDDLLEQIPYCNNRIIRMDNGQVYGSNENIRHIMSAMRANEPVYCVGDFKYTDDEVEFINTYFKNLLPEDLHFIEHSTTT